MLTVRVMFPSNNGTHTVFFFWLLLHTNIYKQQTRAKSNLQSRMTFIWQCKSGHILVCLWQFLHSHNSECGNSFLSRTKLTSAVPMTVSFGMKSVPANVWLMQGWRPSLISSRGWSKTHHMVHRRRTSKTLLYCGEVVLARRAKGRRGLGKFLYKVSGGDSSRW